MRKILITGKNSYVGKSFEKWLSQYRDSYSVDFISLRDDNWKENDFSRYDVVFHVAGVAHIKETKENESLYYYVNRDLTYDVARKAYSEGVQQFIFLSSMSVYGLDTGVINKKSPLKPKGNYGKSKLEAEELIKSLENDRFKVVIIRPPMIYGKGCKGNYIKLSKFALKTPIFPDIRNMRSMIYIDNLCEFVRLLINNQSRGIYFPQNDEYVCTSDLVSIIAECHGKKVALTKLFNPLLKVFRMGVFSKVFGNLIYEHSMSSYHLRYSIVNFRQSIEATEDQL